MRLKLRKRPIVVEAHQAEARPEFRFPKGTAGVSPGSWVVTEVWSKTYPWTPGASEAMYELAPDSERADI